MRMIVMEDDQIIREQLEIFFSMKGHEVICYNNGRDMLDEADFSRADILLLDINTPHKTGIQCLKELRELRIELPAVFITAMSDIQHVKDAYKYGCSDYVRKPFHMDELELRINHLMMSASSERIAVAPDIEYDIRNLHLYIKGEEVELGENEKNILYLLIKNRGSYVDPLSLKNYVWGDKEVQDNTLRTQIKKLRNKLGESCIQSSRGVGYKIPKHG